MRILMIGDSWGWGEFDADSQKLHFGQLSHEGTSQYLLDIGHVVNNLCCPGDNNLRQLRFLEYELGKNEYDIIIWFVTEPLRNVYEFGPFPSSKDIWNYDYKLHKDYETILAIWFKLTFNNAQRIYDKFKIPFYLVGGICPIHPCIENYNFWIDHYNWGQDIINLDQPYNSAYHSRKFFEEYGQHLDAEKTVKELKLCIQFENTMKNSTRMQSMHPNRFEHKLLTDKIINTLCELKISSKD